MPLDDLRTVVTELGKAVDGNGENLRTLVDSLANLSRSGNDNLPQTISLIRNSDTVLTPRPRSPTPSSTGHGTWA